MRKGIKFFITLDFSLGVPVGVLRRCLKLKPVDPQPKVWGYEILGFASKGPQVKTDRSHDLKFRVMRYW